MTTTSQIVRLLSIGALLAVFSGLSATPVAAQAKSRAVSEQRGAQLVREWNLRKARRKQIVKDWARLRSWHDRNWGRLSRAQFNRYKSKKKRLLREYNLIRSRMHEIKAEYYGEKRGGYVFAGGRKSRTGSTTSRTTKGFTTRKTSGSKTKKRSGGTSGSKSSGSSTGGGGVKLLRKGNKHAVKSARGR